MRKIYHSSSGAVSAVRLKRSFLPAILFILALLPVKLFAAAAPAITSFSPASGPAGTLVTIAVTNVSSPTAFMIGGKSAVLVSNKNSVIVVMVMPGTVNGTISIATPNGTAVSTSNFTITATPYPYVQQGSELMGTGGTGTDSEQGSSVAVSADGNTAILGAPNNNGARGAVWVYTRSAGAWVQQGSKLVGTGGTEYATQGNSVAISADGNTAIVGGQDDNEGQGAAWVFTRSAGVWTQQGAKLIGSGVVEGANQGSSVALSADGNTALVGGRIDNNFQGATWVYTRSGATWTQQGLKLVGTGAVGSPNQGYSVSLSADGNTAMVGGYGDNNDVGAAWIFIRSGGVWSQQGSKLVGAGSVGAASQGTSVSLSADGNTAIVGGFDDNASIGAAWIYVRNSGTWAQQGAKLVGTDNVGAASQGISVSLSADGNTAIVGGYQDNQVGATWVYTRSSGAWAQQGTKLSAPGSPNFSGQGRAVSLSADGSTAVVGAFVVRVYVPAPPTITFFSPAGGPPGTLVTINGANLNAQTALTIGGKSAIVVSNTGGALTAMVMPGTATGAISITTLGGTASAGGNFTVIATKYPTIQQGTKLVAKNNTGAARQGYSVAVSADGNTAIVGGYQDNSNLGAAWIYTRSGTTWTQQGSKLVGTGSTGTNVEQGISVAISADGNTAIAGGWGDNTSIGAAWVFTRSGTTWTQQGAKLTGSGNAGASGQGCSVSLSADGNTAIIGGYTDNASQGAIWVFTRSGTTWTQQGTKLVGTGNIGVANQGYSVSLSADGNTVIAGGYEDNSGIGAAWVYTCNNGAWTQQGAKLVGTGNTGASEQGFSVSISADGNTAIVGGYGDNTAAGAAWVYTRSGTTWAQQGAKLVGIGATGAARQGVSVSLSADGNTSMVGGYTDNTTQGAAWVYTRSGTAWTERGTKLIGTGNIGGAGQGFRLSLSADGNTGIIGGYSDNASQGAAWAFIATPSANAQLSVIKLTPASLLTNTGTTGTTTSYTTSVPNSTASVTITPTAQDPTTTIKINGTEVTSGTVSAGIALAVGVNTITIVATAQDGITTRTYSIAVTRPPSTNALLSTIRLTPASLLTNTGTSGTTTTYTTTANSATTSVTVTPTAQEPNATIKVNGTAVASGTASGSIAIPLGQTNITIVSTAQDGTTKHTYSITVTRVPSTNAALSVIKLTPASLLTNTGTAGATTTYTTSVSNATTSVTVTATAQDANATIKVNGTTVASGTASGSIALAVGQTTISTVVTAQDGATTHTYTITVTRASGPLMSLYTPVSVVQPTDNVTIENDGIMVHQGVSPNGDGLNDVLTIDGITAYPDNRLMIIDRSGAIIFEAKGYNNISKVFDGHSGTNGRMLQPGTYFYSLDYVADGQNRHKTGYIVLRY